MMDTKKKTITYLDVCLDPLSKICLNTEAKEHSQQKSRNFVFSEEILKFETSVSSYSLLYTNLDITMKNMVGMQIIQRHQELY